MGLIRGRGDLQGAADRPVHLPRAAGPAARSGPAVGEVAAGSVAQTRDRLRRRREARRRWRTEGLAADGRKGFEVARCLQLN